MVGCRTLVFVAVGMPDNWQVERPVADGLLSFGGARVGAEGQQ